MAYGPDMDHLVYVGMVGIIDPPRVGVREAIAMLMEGGVTVKMLTGDSEETAKAIGKEYKTWLALWERIRKFSEQIFFKARILPISFLFW